MLPFSFVEVGGEKRAGFVRPQGVDSHHESFPALILAGKMLSHYGVCNGDEFPVFAFCAFDFWL